VQESELEMKAYKYILSTYIVCENGKAVPRQSQKMFVETAGSKIIQIAAGPHAYAESTRRACEEFCRGIEGSLRRDIVVPLRARHWRGICSELPVDLREY
jgi:hypothetical protein